MDPNYAYALLGRSLVRRKSGDFVGAAQDIDRAFRRDTKFSWVYRTGRDASPAEIERGIRELDRAVGASSGCPSLYAWRGELKARKGASSEACRDFERALSLDPRHAIGLALYGRTLLGSGRHDEAAELLKKAVRIDPEIRMAAGWLADCRFQKGRTKLAFDTLDGVLKLHPNTDWPHLLKGQFLLKLGEFAPAARNFERATRINGHCHEGYYFRALADLERGRVRSARVSINKCLTIAPNLGRAYLLRAAIQERLGKSGDVLRDYRKVLEEYPYLFNAEQRRRVEALLAGRPSSSRC